MSLTIRVTERTGDTERTIVIGEPLSLPQLRVHAIDLGEFLSGGKTAEARAPLPAYFKLDAKLQRLEDDHQGAAWVYSQSPVTGLIWTREQLLGGKKLNYADAEKACADVGDGFRLPTLPERYTIVDYGRHEPAINTDYFSSPSSGYEWTSTPCAWNAASAAWVVYLGLGTAYNLSRSFVAFVRAVRSGVPSGQ